MKISLRFLSKAAVFVVLIVISIVGPLKTAIDDYVEVGSKTKKSTVIVSSYQSPAITLCFAPPFNASSNLYASYFEGQPSNYAWHDATPLWDLFNQSSYSIQKDFDVIFNYVGNFSINDQVLNEGTNELGNGKEIQVILLPSLEGMCHIFKANFEIHVRDTLKIWVKFKDPDDKPLMVTTYLTAPNDWSLIALGEGDSALRFQFEILKEFYYKFSLKLTDWSSNIIKGNDDCDYGCREEQCPRHAFDDYVKWVKSLDGNSQCKPCLPFLLKGPYVESSKDYEMCQDRSENDCFFRPFWSEYHRIVKYGAEEDFLNDCFQSKHTAKYEGNYIKEFAPVGDQNKDLKLAFSFPSRIMVKEVDEYFVTPLEFFVAIVGSLGAFIDFCLQTYLNGIIDFGFNMMSNSN